MKPRCPTNCGRDIGANYVLCEACFALVPRPLINELAQVKAIIRQTRTAHKLSNAFRRQRLATQAAVQYVIDKQNEKVSA